jgi:large subunit ribosomal protein L29
MKIAELRAKSKEELKDLVLSLKKEQFNLRMQDSTGALESRGRFIIVRRTIARAKTLMNESPDAAKKTAAPKAKKEKTAAPKKTAAKKAKKEKE